MGNQTSFKEGNEHRYTSEHKPRRSLTSKQQVALLESLLAMPVAEVRKIACDETLPVVMYNSANYILNGEEGRVVGLIAQYRAANEHKREYKKKNEM